MKQDANVLESRTNILVARHFEAADEEVMAHLPKIETIRRDVRRQRQFQQGLPVVPDPFNTLFEIPNQLEATMISALEEIFPQVPVSQVPERNNLIHFLV